MLGVKVFIDSNTFLYSFDARELQKSRSACEWLEALSETSIGITNLQVLNEIANVMVRKRNRFGGEHSFFRVDAFALFGSTPVSFDNSLAAREIHGAYRYSWWDCLLLASALDLGCTHFLSEDLQDGQVVDIGDGKALTILSPFAHTPGQVLGSR